MIRKMLSLAVEAAKDLCLSIFGKATDGFALWRWDAPTQRQSTEETSK
jgi:gamma-glutamyl:cysteine ligase YbdK (ATP-grasp superfamily)